MKESCLVTCFPNLLSLLSYANQDHLPRGVTSPSRLSTFHSHQSLIKKIQYRLSYRQPDVGSFTITTSHCSHCPPMLPMASHCSPLFTTPPQCSPLLPTVPLYSPPLLILIFSKPVLFIQLCTISPAFLLL